MLQYFFSDNDNLLNTFQIDLQLESGEYFLSDKKKSARKWQEKQEKQAEKAAENKRKREAAFIPPKVGSGFQDPTCKENILVEVVPT